MHIEGFVCVDMRVNSCGEVRLWGYEGECMRKGEWGGL